MATLPELSEETYRMPEAKAYSAKTMQYSIPTSTGDYFFGYKPKNMFLYR